MAVEERCGSLGQPAALRRGKLVQQGPMLLDYRRTRCLGIKRGLRRLQRELVGAERQFVFALHMRGKGLDASGQLSGVELNSFSFHGSRRDLAPDWTGLVLPNGFGGPKNLGMEVMAEVAGTTNKTDGGAGA